MLIDNPTGNYRFLSGIEPYSCGVVAMPGFEIVHVTLRTALPYIKGFDLISQYLKTIDRPERALCGIELRLPVPLSFGDFIKFNKEYQEKLASWDLHIGDLNPIARTNISPIGHHIESPSLYAFSYTAPLEEAQETPTFIVAGAGDLSDQTVLAPSAVIRAGETSEEALREKAEGVMEVMKQRIHGLQVNWADSTCIDIYTQYPIQPILMDTILNQIGPASAHGIHWHFGNPPIKDLIFEMDLRGVQKDIWVG